MRFLLEWTVEVSILLGMGLAAAGLLRTRSAAFRHRLLSVAFLVAAAMPAIALVAPGWEVDTGAVESVMSFLPETSPGDTAVARSVTAETSTVVASSRVRVASIVLATWIVGAIIALSMLVVGWVRLGRLARSGQPAAEGAWTCLTGRIAGAIGMPSGPDPPGRFHCDASRGRRGQVGI